MTERELSDIEKLMLETLDFYKYKLLDGSCTNEELNNLYKLASSDVTANASIRDLSEFFGESEPNVRHVISRKLIAKPKRVVLYPFQAFLKVVPVKWLKRNKKDK